MVSASCAQTNREIDNIAFVSAELVDVSAQNVDLRFAPEYRPLAVGISPEMGALKIQVSSNVDLVRFAKRTGFNIGSDVNNCKPHGKDEIKIGGGYVYSAGFAVSPDMENNPRGDKATEPIQDPALTYTIYVPVQRAEVKGGAFASPAFDLAKNPQDICLQLRGGDMAGGTFVSNTVVIPKDRLSLALQKNGK